MTRPKLESVKMQRVLATIHSANELTHDQTFEVLRLVVSGQYDAAVTLLHTVLYNQHESLKVTGRAQYLKIDEAIEQIKQLKE